MSGTPAIITDGRPTSSGGRQGQGRGVDRKGSAGRGGKGHAAGVRGAPQPARMLRPIEPRPLREIQREIEAYRAKFDGSSGNWPRASTHATGTRPAPSIRDAGNQRDLGTRRGWANFRRGGMTYRRGDWTWPQRTCGRQTLPLRVNTAPHHAGPLLRITGVGQPSRTELHPKEDRKALSAGRNCTACTWRGKRYDERKPSSCGLPVGPKPPADLPASGAAARLARPRDSAGQGNGQKQLRPPVGTGCDDVLKFNSPTAC